METIVASPMLLYRSGTQVKMMIWHSRAARARATPIDRSLSGSEYPNASSRMRGGAAVFGDDNRTGQPEEQGKLFPGAAAQRAERHRDTAGSAPGDLQILVYLNLERDLKDQAAEMFDLFLERHDISATRIVALVTHSIEEEAGRVGAAVRRACP